MAYKFFTGTLNTSGALNVENAITGNAVRVDTGGVVVSSGNIVASTSELTASAVSSSTAQFGTLTVATFSPASISATSLTATTGSFTRVSGGFVDLITDNTVPVWDDTNGRFANSAVVSSFGGLTTLSNGLTVTTGTSALQATTATTVSATSLTATTGSFTRLSGTAFTGITNQNLPSWDGGLGQFEDSYISRNGFGKTTISGALGLDVTGAVAVVGTLSASSTLQVGGISTLQAVNAQAVTATTLSASSGLQLGGGIVAAGNAVITGSLIVNGAVTFPNTVTIKDLYVTGTITSVSTTNLDVADAKIVIASGSMTTASFDTLDPVGLYVGGAGGNGTDAFGRIALNHDAGAWTWEVFASGAIDPALKVGNGNNGSVAIGSTTVLSQTALFSGAVTGSSAGVGLKLKYTSITTTPFTPALSEYVLGVTTTSTAITISLPAPGAGDVGRVLLIKDVSNNASVNNITITPNGSDTIDGVNASVKLESNSAAVHCIVTAANKWGLF